MDELLNILKTNENIQVGENIPEESENFTVRLLAQNRINMNAKSK
jgi:hypothetical protein